MGGLKSAAGHADAVTGNEPPIGAVLLRVGDMNALLELICDCARADRPWHGPERAPHLWLCPAGVVEFWCSRQPVSAQAWLDALAVRPPPEPVW